MHNMLVGKPKEREILEDLGANGTEDNIKGHLREI